MLLYLHGAIYTVETLCSELLPFNMLFPEPKGTRFKRVHCSLLLTSVSGIVSHSAAIFFYTCYAEGKE